MTTSAVAFDPGVFDNLIQRYRAQPTDPLHQRWLLLEAAHVVGQTRLVPHLQVHWAMLGLAWKTGDGSEIRGQLLRLLLVPLGHLFGRLPLGNPGRAHVSAFQPMQPSPAILQAIAESDQKRL